MWPNRARITEWMDRASSGDDDAFARLAEAAQDELYRFALAHGLQPADAAEATQEVLLRAYRRRRAWRGGGNAAGWLVGIAMNVVRERLRKGRRGAATGLDPAVFADATQPLGPAEDPEWPARLAEALARLPPRRREAVTCRYLRQMSVRQTAAAMGCAEGTVKAAVAAALANLREILGAEP